MVLALRHVTSSLGPQFLHLSSPDLCVLLPEVASTANISVLAPFLSRDSIFPLHPSSTTLHSDCLPYSRENPQHPLSLTGLPEADRENEDSCESDL